jgi:hypothetical protein
MYLARLLDREIPGFPGSEQLLAQGGLITTARRPALLTEEAQRQRQPPLVVSECTMELVDLRMVARAIDRSPTAWSGQVRGTIVAADNLLFDIAATVGDRRLGERVMSGKLHDLYRFIWGEQSSVEDAPKVWSDMVAQLLSRLSTPLR